MAINTVIITTIILIIIIIMKEIDNMINVNLNFNEMATLLFGAEEATKMKERAARRAEADAKA